MLAGLVGYPCVQHAQPHQFGGQRGVVHAAGRVEDAAVLGIELRVADHPVTVPVEGVELLGRMPRRPCR
jgi:hypothetical protein